MTLQNNTPPGSCRWYICQTLVLPRCTSKLIIPIVQLNFLKWGWPLDISGPIKRWTRSKPRETPAVKWVHINQDLSSSSSLASFPEVWLLKRGLYLGLAECGREDRARSCCFIHNFQPASCHWEVLTAEWQNRCNRLNSDTGCRCVGQ